MAVTTNQRRLTLYMVGIFLCGCIVGGVITRAMVRYQLQMALRNPEQLPARISAGLVRTIRLRDDQRHRIEDLIARRYAQMEALRATTYPQQLAEFDALCTEVQNELDDAQKKSWTQLVSRIRDEYIPVAPVIPPPAEFLFGSFDTNQDGKLEQAELPPRMWQHVRKADANADNAVTQIEFQAARQAVLQQQSLD